MNHYSLFFSPFFFFKYSFKFSDFCETTANYPVISPASRPISHTVVVYKATYSRNTVPDEVLEDIHSSIENLSSQTKM